MLLALPQARPLDQLHSRRGRHVIEADLRWSAGDLDRPEDQAIGLRAKVLAERRLGLPSFDEHEAPIQAVLLVDVAGDAARLGKGRPLNTLEDVEHFGSSLWCRPNPD